MKKRVLLIGNPGDEDADNYCRGVLRDIDNYKQYFMSFAGGEWYESEIKTMLKPSKIEVETEISKMQDLDYSIIVFSGHGYSKDNITYIETRPGKNNYP